MGIPSPKWRVERRRLNPRRTGNVSVEIEFTAGAAVAFNTLEDATTHWRSPSPSLRSPQRIGCHHHTLEVSTRTVTAPDATRVSAITPGHCLASRHRDALDSSSALQIKSCTLFQKK